MGLSGTLQCSASMPCIATPCIATPCVATPCISCVTLHCNDLHRNVAPLSLSHRPHLSSSPPNTLHHAPDTTGHICMPITRLVPPFRVISNAVSPDPFPLVAWLPYLSVIITSPRIAFASHASPPTDQAEDEWQQVTLSHPILPSIAKHRQDASGCTLILPPVQERSLPIPLSPQTPPRAEDEQKATHSLRRMLGSPSSQDQRMPGCHSVER